MSELVFTGTVRRLGDFVDTDAILPAKYLNLTTPEALAAHVLENHAPDFRKILHAGDILVAGRNFGCGSSREHAPLALKGSGVACVIAESFARIFFRNSINLGLPVVELADAGQLAEGHTVRVDCGAGLVSDETSGKTYKVALFPDFMREILKAGGVIPYIENQR
ncbi:MAG: 3-isopropylmalate dehydratase small subunit [Methylobacteriaceae bacterium]|jgi:3-isopropylmalate/(R)-2-methylmalate dehydratase small subunit|nr:3-isopropylmalate dehydratase small subunit [Methylobacteriaceae bacterium]